MLTAAVERTAQIASTLDTSKALPTKRAVTSSAGSNATALTLNIVLTIG